MNLLFQAGDFISHAGLPLKWKIECDAITNREWDCLATMIMDYQKEPFSKAIGIPRGGLQLEQALKKYETGNSYDPVLICDDVYTTGTSFREFDHTVEPIKYFKGGEIRNSFNPFKWVVFARKPTTDGVRALFTMPEEA